MGAQSSLCISTVSIFLSEPVHSVPESPFPLGFPWPDFSSQVNGAVLLPLPPNTQHLRALCPQEAVGREAVGGRWGCI